MTIRFDEAWTNARDLANQISAAGTDVVLIRNLVGRISMVIGDGIEPKNFADLETRIHDAAGLFTSSKPFLREAELFAPSAILDSPDLVIHRERKDSQGRMAILERTVVGADWVRPQEQASRKHVTLYGFKGGVGRSTAAFLLAQHIAASGKCVLVIDLDLESPGVGALLSSDSTQLPDYGVVDHLVEAAVHNQADLDLVAPSLAASSSSNGELWLAPASGRPRNGYNYIAKLNRVYTDLPADTTSDRRTFSTRLRAAVDACELRVRELSRSPDVILLDSRAGIHDIAAVAITQLSDLSLLFGTDNRQTWTGYHSLFTQWRDNLAPTELHQIRQRLRMVASMVPSANKDSYLETFRDHAQECFENTLYDIVEQADDTEAFNFSLGDENAPHSPIPIYFNTDLVALNPATNEDWHRNPLIRAAYEDFLISATQLILEGNIEGEV